MTDGSTDRHQPSLLLCRAPNVRLLHQPERRGKVGADPAAFPQAHGEVVVFSDANSYFQPDTLRKLVRNFADPEVGGASGAKRMLSRGDAVARSRGGAILAL